MEFDGALNAIREQVRLGHLRRSVRQGDRFWGGAGVIVSNSPQPQAQDDAFYPDPIWIQTAYPAELTWLFCEVRDRLINNAPCIDKEALYGEIAQAVEGSQRWLQDRPEDVRHLLDAALDGVQGFLERTTS
jgi:hypothetical protein